MALQQIVLVFLTLFFTLGTNQAQQQTSTSVVSPVTTVASTNATTVPAVRTTPLTARATPPTSRATPPTARATPPTALATPRTTPAPSVPAGPSVVGPPVVEPGSRASDCKVAYTVGYGYRRIYHWADSLVHKRNSSFSVTSATLKFRVRAFSNAHIMLSTSSNPVDREPVYEIVLGAGQNKFSDIRRLRRTGTRATQNTPDIVSPYELRGFWIRLSSDGTIEVGREKDDLAILGWRDPYPLPVRYFAFCTWTGVVGKWEYDCPSDNPEEQEDTEVERVPKTWTEKLRKNLLTDYDPYSRPVMKHETITNVFLHFACQHVHLDDKSKSISVSGTMSMHWVDEKLVWDPEQYGQLKSLHVAMHELWMPELLLYNAADGIGDNIFTGVQTSLVTVHADGSVMWSPQVGLKALCELNFAGWPQDSHTCVLRLGVWSHAQTVKLQLMENGTVLDAEHTSSQWKITEISAQRITEPHPWMFIIDDDSSDDILTDVSGSIFQLQLTTKRKSSTHLIIFMIPLVVSCFHMLSTFWISPLDGSRFIFCLINLTTILMFLNGIGLILPPTADDIPKIVSLYKGVLLIATSAILVSVLVITVARTQFASPPPSIIAQHLNGRLGRLLLLPPPIQKENNDGSKPYGQLDEGPNSQSASPILTEELQELATFMPTVAPTGGTNNQEQWVRVAIAMDRFLFLVHLIVLGSFSI